MAAPSLGAANLIAHDGKACPPQKPQHHQRERYQHKHPDHQMGVAVLRAPIDEACHCQRGKREAERLPAQRKGQPHQLGHLHQDQNGKDIGPAEKHMRKGIDPAHQPHI